MVRLFLESGSGLPAPNANPVHNLHIQRPLNKALRRRNKNKSTGAQSKKQMSKQSTHARHSVNTTIPLKCWKCDDEPGCEANTSKAKKTRKKTAILPKITGPTNALPLIVLAGCCTPTLALTSSQPKKDASTTSDCPRMKLCFHPTGYCQKRKKKKSTARVVWICIKGECFLYTSIVS